jgi:hypothetical protein
MNHKTNLRRFAAHFGACPETCSSIFVDLQTTQIAASRIAKPQVFYLYSTGKVRAGKRAVCRKSLHKKILLLFIASTR